MNFNTFRLKNDPDTPTPKCLLALDPGETTGWAVFKDGVLANYGQLPTHTVEASVPIIMNLLEEYEPTKLVYEDYKVYGWKTQSHAWDSLHTPRLIGNIQTLCVLQNIPISAQMAQHAKQFCTDSKLKMWGYYKPGMKHARDAIRHGCYYILFNHKKYL